MLDSYFQSPRLEALQKQSESISRDNEKRIFLTTLISTIIDAINEKTINTIEEGVNVNNLDEIQASLRNELNKANKPITDLLKTLNLSTKEQTKAIQGIENKPIEVSNLQEVIFPDEIKINNLKDLAEYFTELSNKISALELSVTLPAPQITVQPTPINIPETIIPSLDLSPIIKELEKGLKILRTNNKSNPLAVRLTDGGDWVKELKTLNKSAAQTTQFMSDVSYIKDVNGNRINPSTAEGQSYMLVPKIYDYIELSPATQPTTIIYKSGGTNGMVVATLTITYSGSNIASVTRT